MTDLSTTYMGLKLKNPLIVSSSSLTNKISGVKNAAEAGAGAIVLKSLFEEQILAEMRKAEESTPADYHPEASDYLQNVSENLQSAEYLQLIEGGKKEVDIPLIASLNCISESKWADYAKDVEAAGADGLELNIAILPNFFDDNPEKIEQRVVEILKLVRSRISIPIAVKLGPYYTSIPAMVKKLEKAGAASLVLFNRFYRPDIDLDKIKLTSAYRYSSPEEISQSLRWIGLLHQHVKCDLCGATGIFDGNGVVKQILAGAQAVQICSTLYINGIRQIGIIKERMEYWMEQHKYSSLDNFRGIMSQQSSKQQKEYERLQYIKALVGIE